MRRILSDFRRTLLLQIGEPSVTAAGEEDAEGARDWELEWQEAAC